MTDKAKLEKLILLIGDLLQEKENAWMVDALLQTIENTAPLDKIAGNDVIQHIHEYCVEQKIDAQARAFYAKFPITQIREQLIEDYKKMEHERRRDDFNNFCLCMYQQIENIVSLFFHELIEPNWENLKERPAIQVSVQHSKQNL
ncbi:hypothetical protein A3SI_15443 [Nitritalea halalkaliphila LW7]|uniref:Uncharacterized protein n=1 Tax=Nitritalea halalkaliphila LW7 TaxID=1189621 RepID=I5BYD8_9BACT|nr:hypothetical protein [Nitritalea halalkaliphila]EIM74590.1 hypothetical protein A3SI_15443 [Nitritalea halalkaliphila LW7]